MCFIGKFLRSAQYLHSLFASREIAMVVAVAGSEISCGGNGAKEKTDGFLLVGGVSS